MSSIFPIIVFILSLYNLKNTVTARISARGNRKLSLNENYSSENQNYDIHRILSMDLGYSHACIIDINKQVYCWGQNIYGILGYGDTISRESHESYPVDLGSNRIPKKIVVGDLSSCVLLESNDLICWGFGTGRITGTPFFNLGDTVVKTGDFLPFVDFGTGRKVKKVSMGFATGCAILDNDMLKCWGENGEGQAGQNNTIYPDIFNVGDTLPYVDIDGTVVKDVSVGFKHTCAVTDTRLSCWGANDFGKLGYGDTENRIASPDLPDYNFTNTVVRVFSLYDSTCALFDNNQVKCWGRNSSGQLGFGYQIGAVKGDPGFSQGDSSDELPNTFPFVDFGTDLTAVKIGGSKRAMCALLDDQSVKCMGWNYRCSLGSGEAFGSFRTQTGDNLPRVNFGSRTVTDILSTGSGYSMCAVFGDDTFSCWGANQYFQLGNNGKEAVGCSPHDMGDNLLPVCAKNRIDLNIETDENPTNTSWTLMHTTENVIVMQARSGYYVAPYFRYEKTFCAPKGNYAFRIQYGLGEFTGTYEISANNNRFYFTNTKGFRDYNETKFILCYNNTVCSSNTCSVGFCNGGACNQKRYYHSGCAFGEAKTIIFRVTADDVSTSASASELSDSFFVSQGNNFTMKSQFSACSYEQFHIVPFIGKTYYGRTISNGVEDIKLTDEIIGSSATDLAQRVLEAASYQLGDISAQFNLVIICLPPETFIGSSKNWKAYAFVNSYVSVFNDLSCLYPSVQMHEVGHNLGLSHSNDESNYGDWSGYMGQSFSSNVGPKQCFNAPKSFELEWYSGGYLQADWSDILGTTIELVGISDYEERGYRATHVKITNTGNGFDYYVSFNRKSGMNCETREGADQVLITKRRLGEYYDDSELIARLSHLQKFTLYLGTQAGLTMQITPNINLYAVPAYAQVVFESTTKICESDDVCDDSNFCTIDKCNEVNDTEICTYTPKNCDDCGAMLTLDVHTNEFPNEIIWDIKKLQTNQIVKSSVQYDKNNTSYQFHDCFEYGRYIFTIFYTNSTADFENTGSFSLKISDEVIDQGSITELFFVQATFTICNNDIDCSDYNGCIVDYCNLESNLCNNYFKPESEECDNCIWFSYELIFDNFPEEITWSIIDVTTDTMVEFGEPDPVYLLSLGGKTTESGRSEAQNLYGRRKAPTRFGRRKAPTRSSPNTNNVARGLDEEDSVSARVCLEENVKYHFVIHDSFGDGMCCEEGRGSYALTISDKEIKTGGEFDATEDLIFKLTLYEEGCNENDPSLRYVYDPEISTCIYYSVDCEEYGAMVNVKLKTDLYADDTSWKILSIGDNNLFLEGGMYVVAYNEYESMKCFPFGSYSFYLVDALSDGMAFCFDFDCGYSISINNSTVFEGDGSFGGSSSHVIGICSNDQDCDDGDACTQDSCNVEKRFCVFEHLACSACNKETLTIDVHTDYLFSLTSWEVKMKGTRESTFAAGPYVKSFHHYHHTYCISIGHYIFTISNSEGRGLSLCHDSSCGFTLAMNNKTIKDNDGSFEYVLVETFVVCDDDSFCDDKDDCTFDSCDLASKTCTFQRLPCSVCNKKKVVVDVNTDGNSTETSWEILKNDVKIATGGKYAQNFANYYHEYCLSDGDFSFTMQDSAGNGFSLCSENSCGYELRIEDEVIIKSDGSFSYTETNTFGFCSDEASCENRDPCIFRNCDQVTKICTYDLQCKLCEKDQVSIEIITDLDPLETNWKIVNQNDLMILSGGPYISSFTQYLHTYCLDGGNYTFAIFDEAGNGFSSCSSNNCGYKLAVNNEAMIESDGLFLYSDSYSFEIERNETNRTVDNFHDTSAFLSLVQSKIVNVAVGFRHTCVLTLAGSVFCFGDNEFGQLGYGDTIRRNEARKSIVPIDIGKGNFGKELFSGAFHNCLLLVTDDLFCWGLNSFGQLGIGSKTNVGVEHAQMGSGLKGVKLGQGRKVKKASLGYLHTCAILDDDTLKCWGSNQHGQLGYERMNYNIGIHEHQMGDNLNAVDFGIEAVVDEVSAGLYHTCVKMRKSMKCFGQNLFGQLGYGDTLNRGLSPYTMGDYLPFVDVDGAVKQVSAANSVTCAVLEIGKVKCFGYNIFSQLGYGDKIQRGNSPGSTGENLPFLYLGNATFVEKITRGAYSFCALMENKSVKCWGWNYQCTLGLGDDKDRSDVNTMGDNLPFLDFGAKKIRKVEMFHMHICAIFTDETLSCWGFNRYGMLGNGKETNLGCKPDEIGDNFHSMVFYEPVSWNLVFDKASTTGDLEELIIEYNISKSLNADHFMARILDESCSVISNSSSITANPSIQILHFASHNKGIVDIKFNFSLLESSNNTFWERLSENIGRINFCLRTDLLMYSKDLNSSVSFTETKIITHVNFDKSFRGFAIERVSLDKNGDSYIHRNFYLELSACICNKENYCVDTPLLFENSKIRICVIPQRNDVHISKFDSVHFYQDGILKYAAVEDGKDMPLTTSSHGEISLLKTRLITTFFESPHPSNILIEGTVIFDFIKNTSNRFLLENAENKVTFQFEVALAGNYLLKNYYLIVILIVSVLTIAYSHHQKRNVSIKYMKVQG